MIDAIITELCDIVEREKTRSYECERYFHSTHEAESVIREEVEELQEATQELTLLYKRLWGKVRRDAYIGIMVPYKMKQIALNAAAEAVQTAAMCDKLMDSTRKWEEMKKNGKTED